MADNPEQINTVLSSEMGPSIDALLHAVDVLSFKIVGPDCWYHRVLQNDWSTHLKFYGEGRFIGKT